MEKKISFYHIPLIQICVTFLVLFVISMLFIDLSCRRMSKVVETFTQEESFAEDVDKKISLVFLTPQDKRWRQPDGSVGAQYDGMFFNHTNHVFTDWTLKVYLPENYMIDSTWNGKFSLYYTGKEPVPPKHSYTPEYLRQYEDISNYLIIESNDEDANTILEVAAENAKYKNSFSVGMIMYTPDGFEINKLEISGRFIYSPWNNPGFMLLGVLAVFDIIMIITLVIIQGAVTHRLKSYVERQKVSNAIIIQSFKTFANFVDAKDPYTKGHSLRVAYYAREIARRLKMTDQQQTEIFWEGLMHDVGKISVHDEILNKPSSLTNEEFSEIQAHASKGYDMLKDFTAMPMLKEVANSHHEHWDGSGYPEHLSHEEIPIEARIVCICDCFDAMNSDRCYRHRLSKEQIVDEFNMNSGVLFDPALVPIMLEMIEDGFTDSSEEIEYLNTFTYKV